MRFLKKKITRVIAFLISCVLVFICIFSAAKTILNHSIIYDNEADYLETIQYEHDINHLFVQLWAIGNMYLRNLDDKGNFIGSDEMKKSTEDVLKSLELMDKDGNLTVSDLDMYDYYLSWGEHTFSNTDKKYDELLDPVYSLIQTEGSMDYIPNNLYWWHSDLYWYQTNYGMTYYFFSDMLDQRAAAVYDFKTDGLNYYFDDNGTKLYYKTDGTTPIPFDYSDLENSDAEYEEIEKNYGNDAMDSVTPAGDPTVPEPPKIAITNEEGRIVRYNGNDMMISDENGFFVRSDDSDNGWVYISNDSFVTKTGDERPLTICITPKEPLIAAHETYMADLDNSKKDLVHSLINLIPLIAAVFILFVYILFAGGYSLSSSKFVMSVFDKVYAEVYILIAGAAWSFGLYMLSDEVLSGMDSFFEAYYNSNSLMSVVYGIVYTLIFALTVGIINSLIVRLKCKSFWRRTLVGSVILWIVKQFKKLHECIRVHEMFKNNIFARRFIIRFVISGIIEIFVFLIGVDNGSAEFILFGSILIAAMFFILNIKDLNELTKLSKQISDMNGGIYDKQDIPESSIIYGMTNNLNNISDGIKTAVDEQIKSERMKIDLVTNVSHDLKTPLTSIIGYIDLLSKEELNPEAKDYVTILEQKSERLKAIVFDLFDLAKATSRTDFQLELIDVVVLIGQVLGDMSDKISSYDREIRSDILLKAAPVYADGKKLYRVIQNLIDNALKYSLNGTRIYMTLRENNKKAILTIKNISSYEMDFTPEEITERFTRGDKSRTSEGSGLGLSIAKSFTEACGGEFRVIVDGDVFAAEVSLPIVEKEITSDNE